MQQETNLEIHDVLKQTFGIESFRGQQLEIIQRTLSSQHSLVLMPTGMGKSLCFQIPALVHSRRSVNAVSQRPLTLVLSPLIALMKDQVDGLVNRGVAATFINSSLTAAERNERYAVIENGEFDLLYVTPERFRKEEFNHAISCRKIVLLAVDEAHCISEWGHDFRPDYSRVGEFRERLGNPTTIALTATATPDVQHDIVRQLLIDPENIQTFNAGLERPNLSLNVKPVWGEDERLQEIENAIRQFPCGIVYFTLIRTLEHFSELLRQREIPHCVYHGDLPRDRRRNIQTMFMNDGGVVLATNAFGMGVDKSDIRFVIHAELPGSLEAYYQEIGRAGRDGESSECILLYDQHDLETQMEFLRWSNPDARFYQLVYEALVNDRESINAFGMPWLNRRLTGNLATMQESTPFCKCWSVME
ncbi:MAG: RecQ family ATP-dependent DNA helicase [Pirellulaceae bacterium]